MNLYVKRCFGFLTRFKFEDLFTQRVPQLKSETNSDQMLFHLPNSIDRFNSIAARAYFMASTNF